MRTRYSIHPLTPAAPRGRPSTTSHKASATRSISPANAGAVNSSKGLRSPPTTPKKQHVEVLIPPRKSANRVASAVTVRARDDDAPARKKRRTLTPEPEFEVKAPHQPKYIAEKSGASSEAVGVTEDDGGASLPTPASTPTKRELPATGLTPRRIPNVYAHAAALLSTSNNSTTAPLPLHGRTAERAILNQFLAARFPDVYPSLSPTSSPPPASRSSLYISGPPGIGKTALLSSVVAELEATIEQKRLGQKVRVVMENCSSIGSVGMEAAFWERLATGLGLDLKAGSKQVLGGRKARVAFEEAIGRASGRYLVILDEIDHLLPTTPNRGSSSNSSPSAARDLLNTIFSLAQSIPHSRLTLVGIANALDLTARSLRLEAFGPSATAGPQVLNFRPYASDALETIVKDRLARLSPSYPLVDAADTDEPEATEPLSPSATPGLALVEPKALELCAKRVAKATGDVRVVLDVLRKAIALVEQAELAKLTSEAPSTSSPSRASGLLSHLTPSTATKVSIKTMLEALRTANLSTPPALATQLASLNFDHRAALIGIVVALARSAPPGVGFDVRPETVVLESVAYGAYVECLTKEGTMGPKNANAFRDALDALECAGLVRGAKNRSRPRSSGGPSPSRLVGGSGKAIVLSEHSVADLVEGLRTTPSRACEIDEEKGKSEGAMQETLRISKKILDREEGRLAREKEKAKKSLRDVEAPMVGFNGQGLDEGTKYLGEARRH